ncbi:hypothetical protein BDF22DRAFT_683384 [Syncephalis plumigaleata]|nr:hypothetical protein BDF22DRAFT_683384 [Syncephalis plumigaleata]
MTNYLACPCLNLRLHLPSRSSQLADRTNGADLAALASEANTAKQVLNSLPHRNHPSGWKLVLGLGGATAEHETLIVVRPAVKRWHIVQCLNCNCSLYAYKETHRDDSFQNDNKMHGLYLSTSVGKANQQATPSLSPADGRVCVLEQATVLAGKEIIAAQQNERFSRAFRVILQTSNDDIDMEDDNEANVLETSLITEKTEHMLKEYELVEEAAIEQRVIEYRNEQNALLGKRMQQAKHEQSLMIRQLLKANSLRNRATLSSDIHDDASNDQLLPLLLDTQNYQSSDDNADNLSDNDAATDYNNDTAGTSFKPSSMLVGSLQQNNLAMLSGLNTTRVERLAQQAPAIASEVSTTTTTTTTTTTSDDDNSQMASPLFEKVVPSSLSTSMLSRTLADNSHHSIGAKSDNNSSNNNGHIRKGLLSSQTSRLNEEDINDAGMDNDDDDLFLLDEETEADDMNTNQPYVGSLRDNQFYQGNNMRDIASSITSRPGMHFGTSMMTTPHSNNNNYGGVGIPTSLSQSMSSNMSTSIGAAGKWKQRPRQKYLPELDDNDHDNDDDDDDDDKWLGRVTEESSLVGDDEARDGLSALRQQTNILYNRGQSPTESTSGGHHMFATSLPINIHRQKPPSNRAARKAKLPNDGAMNALPVSSTATGIAAIRAGSLINDPRANAELLNDLSNDFDTDDDEEFVAPHLLAARTYTDSNRAIFGSIPRSSRIHSVAI